MSITQTEYTALQLAYDHFNRTLFAEQLPPVLITLQRKAGSMGYFSPNRFQARGDTLITVFADAADELALNPECFQACTDEQILQTLVHEMAHVWQQHCGRPPRKAYHDREWATMMKEIGLHPSSTGQPGGKETGPKMSDYIIPNGPFQITCAELLDSGLRFNWQSPASAPDRKKKKASKTKYTCMDCGLNAWAKPGASLICFDCMEPGEDGEPGEIVCMVAEQQEDEEE